MEVYKEKLSQLVEEVMYFESEASTEREKATILAQALVDNSAAHGTTMKAFTNLISSFKKVCVPNDEIESSDSKLDYALENLRIFQLNLQKKMSSAGITLPAGAHFKTASLLSQNKPNTSLNAVNEELALLRIEKKQMSSSIETLERRNRQLELELSQAVGKSAWTFKDDHLSSNGVFGMSSNSVKTGSNDVSGLRLEVERLNKIVESQRHSHERERDALIHQAEIELNDAETTIDRLRGDSLSLQDHLPSPRLKVNSLKIHRNGDVDLIGAVSSFDSRQRLSELETSVARERLERHRLESELETAVKDKQKVLDRLRALQLEQGINHEESQTDKMERTALRNELEKVQRDREVLAREYRAAEKRHEGLMLEMRQVMEDRDKALAAAEESRREYLNGLTDAEKSKNLLLSECAAKEQILSELRDATDMVSQLESQVESLKRAKSRQSQDVMILQQQRETIIMERDAAIKEQQHAMQRVDSMQSDRKRAMETRDEAVQQVSGLQTQLTQVQIGDNRMVHKVRDLESCLDDLNNKLESNSNKLHLAQESAATAMIQLETALEAKLSAEQDREVSQRQCKALTDELKSVLRVRDIALAQRDAAMSQGQIPSRIPSSIQNNDETLEELVETRLAEENAVALCEQYESQIEKLQEKLHIVEAGSIAKTAAATQLESAASGLETAKLVGFSKRLSDLHLDTRVCQEMLEDLINSNFPDIAKSPSNSLQNSAVGCATKSQTTSEIFMKLSKQMQVLEVDTMRVTKAIKHVCSKLHADPTSHNLVEFSKKSKQVQQAHMEIHDLRDALQLAEMELAQAKNQLHYFQNSRIETSDSRGMDLQVEIDHLKHLVEMTKRDKSGIETRLRSELDEERTQLQEALDRLLLADKKANEYKLKMREHLFTVERSEQEKIILESDLRDATSKLKSIASRKTNATKELEEVYDSLNILETQLLNAHSENKRLRELVGDRSVGSDEGIRSRQNAARNIRVKRSGSVVIE